MIKIQYISGLQGTLFCNACGKPWQYDKKMVQIHFQDGNGFGVLVVLCDDCRRELYEKI